MALVLKEDALARNDISEVALPANSARRRKYSYVDDLVISNENHETMCKYEFYLMNYRNYTSIN